MEANGYIFGNGEIKHVDKSGKEWQVVKFFSDGSASIRSLDDSYKGSDATLTAEEVANLFIDPLNAGHDPIVALKDQPFGKVAKFFLPNVDKNASTEAGWVAPIDISQDSRNPTKLDNATPIHNRHVLDSALLGKGGEPWPENFPNTRFFMSPEAEVLTRGGNGRLMEIYIDFKGFDSNGKLVPIQARDVGFVDVNTPEGWVIFPLKQFKINDDGQSVILNNGKSGKIRNLSNFYDSKGNLMALSDFLLYNAYNYTTPDSPDGNYPEFGQDAPGLHWLYNNDPDNKPWELESVKDDVAWLNSLTNEEITNHGKTIFIMRYHDYEYVRGRDITADELLNKLQEKILYPF